jgi:hypothetical protein
VAQQSSSITESKLRLLRVKMNWNDHLERQFSGS